MRDLLLEHTLEDASPLGADSSAEPVTRASGTPLPSTDFLNEIVLDGERDLPLHAQLRISLKRLIDEHFEDQSHFYSESQLIGNLRVSQGTVRRALADLAASGLLEKRQARCTIVRKRMAGRALTDLAVFVPDYSSPNVSRFLTGLNAECLNRSIRMQPIYTHRGERLLKAYDSLKFAPHEGGVVLLENSPRATTELLAALNDKGYDSIVIDTLPQEGSYKFVGVCNTALMEIGLEYLVNLGHRRITLLVNEPEEKASVQKRIEAFQRWTSARPHLVDPAIVRSGAHLWDDSSAAAHDAMEKVMAEGGGPTAIFAISDVGALGAIRWLQQHAWRVPEDVSVMGTDGLCVGTMVNPALTTLSWPIDEIIQAVFGLFSEPGNSRPLTYKPRLIVRESTARPRVV